MKVYGLVEKGWNWYTKSHFYATSFFHSQDERDDNLEQCDGVPFSFELDLDPASLFPEELIVAASPVAVDKTDQACTYPDCSFNGCCGSAPK